MSNYLLVTSLTVSACFATSFSIVPTPHNIVRKSGTFIFPPELSVGFDSVTCQPPADLLLSEIKRYIPATIKKTSTDKSDITLNIASKNLQEQGYKLSVSSKNISIIGHDQHGLFYGVISLLWLVRDSNGGDSIPAITITDWPDVTMRGMDLQWCFGAPSNQVMLDTAHAMAMLKYSFIMPELGPFLKNENFPMQFRKDGISRKQFREFVQYCYSLGLDVIPKLNALGHKERGVPWIKTLGNGLDMGCEENYKMLFDLVESYMKDCPKLQYFHFGMDEAVSCLEENKKAYGKSTDVLLAEHINRICKWCKTKKITPIIYHDMLIGASEDIYWKEGAVNSGTRAKSYPARKTICKDLIIDYWNYEGFARYRTMENVQNEKFRIWFTPWGGVSVNMMAQNAYLLDAGLLGSTWTNVDYKDVRRIRFYTQRWLQDAFSNTASFAWNIKHPTDRIFDPGYDAALITTSMYWDKPDYLPEKSTPIALPECDSYARQWIKDTLQSVHLSSGLQNIKGITFDIDPSQAVVLGNIKSVNISRILSQPQPWTMYVDGKKNKQIDGVDQPRKANSIMLYTRNYGLSSKSNQYGREVSVRCGRTHYGDTWGIGNMSIPRNGFVLSGHGEGLYDARVFNGYHKIKILDSRGKEVLLGKRKPGGMKTAKINIDSKAKSIVFLHTTAYEAAHFMPDMVSINIIYDDGGNETFSLRYGRDICSFDDVCFLYDKQNPQRKWLAAYNSGNELHDGRLMYAYQWPNPHPGKTVRSVTIKVSELGQQIGYLLLGLSVVDE